MGKVNSEKLAEIIQKYILANDISMRSFARKAGLSHAYVDKLRKGMDPETKKPVEPTMDTLVRIAKALEMNLLELLALCEYIDHAEIAKSRYYVDEIKNKLTDFSDYEQDEFDNRFSDILNTPILPSESLDTSADNLFLKESIYKPNYKYLRLVRNQSPKAIPAKVKDSKEKNESKISDVSDFLDRPDRLGEPDVRRLKEELDIPQEHLPDYIEFIEEMREGEITPDMIRPLLDAIKKLRSPK